MGLLESMTVPQAVMAAGPQPVQLQPSFSFGTSGANIRLSPKPEPKDRTPPIKTDDLSSLYVGLQNAQKTYDNLKNSSPYFNSSIAAAEQAVTGGRYQDAAVASPYARIGASNALNAIGAGGIMDTKKLESAKAFTGLNRDVMTSQTVAARILHGSLRNREFIANAIAYSPDYSKGVEDALPIVETNLKNLYGHAIANILAAQKQGMDQATIRSMMGGGTEVAKIMRYGLDNGLVKPSDLISTGWARPKAPDQPGQPAPPQGQPAVPAPVPSPPAQAPAPQAQPGVYRKTF